MKCLFESIISTSSNSHHAESILHFNRKRKDEKSSGYDDDADHSDETFASEDEDLPREEESTVMRILRDGSVGGSSSGAPVYEEVDSFSAESPRYAIQPDASSYRAQPPVPKAPSPPDSNLVALNTQEPLERSQIEPEEEMKLSPNSSALLSESMRDFSIGSRKSSPDPSGDRLRALPPFSADSASDDITNDDLFGVQEQVSRAQSYVTQDSNVSEELDEPRSLPIPPKYDVKQGARHNLSSSSNLSPLNESSKEGRRSSDSQMRSQSGSERSASQSSRRSGSQQSGSNHSGSRQSGSRQSGSYHSGSKHSSEHSQEMEQIPPPPVYRPKPVRQKSQSNRSKSKSRSRSGSGSRGKSRNASHESGRKSQRNQEIYTDSDHDSAEDSPPPTISDSGQSQGSNLSGFSQRSPATKSRSISSKSGKNKGPPPPPFQRSEVDESPQYFTDHDSRRPVNSVFTKSGLSGEDSVVSDPTLDAAFHNAPAPVPVPTRNTSARIPRNHSDPSFDKDKSVTSSPGSDSPEKGYRRSSSDELPPSEKNSSGSGDDKVDNIVAAALAYAEKTHSLSSYDHQTGSPAPQSRKAKKRPSGSSSKRRRRKSDPETRASQSTSSGVGSSVLGSGAVSGASAAVSGASLHSFYSGDDGKKSLESKGTQPSVQDMVSAALAYAEETRQQQRQKSEKSQASSKHTKSVGSMFSDSDAGSYSADEKNEFKC